MKKILFAFLLSLLVPLQACAFGIVETQDTVRVEQPVIIYQQGYGYGYWYQDVWYQAPDDFVYAGEETVIYWGPFVVEPIVYYRMGLGWGYWCDGLWWPAPYGFNYYMGVRPYWGPVYVYGRYDYRGHYCGAYSPPGIHRQGRWIHHPGSRNYIGHLPPRLPVPPLRIAPPRYRPVPPPPHHRAPGPVPRGPRGHFGGHR